MQETTRFNIHKFMQLIEKAELNAIIAMSPQNVYYTSGYISLEPAYIPCATLLFPQEAPVLITPISDYGSTFSCKDLWIDDHRFYGQYYMENLNPEIHSRYPTLFEAIHNVLQERKCVKGTVGFEGSYVSVDMFDKLCKNLPDAKLKTASSVFEEARMIKTSEEVNRLTQTLRLTERILLKTLNEVHVGMTELEVAQILKRAVAEHNSELAFLEMGAGPRSGYVNNRATENRLSQGDILRIDYGIIYDGYASDISRNIVMGEPTTQMRKIHDAILSGQQKAISAVRAGVKVSELFRVGVKEVREAGFPQFWRPNIGHGIGIEPHETPRICPDEKRDLQEGMVINIEMPYYIVGLGGFNIEDTILVLEDGGKVLSETEHDLYSL